jgi:CheY-like chemotaxis protein
MNSNRAQPARILVVEDVQETCDAIEALLKRDGYWTYSARDEAGAVERVRLSRPDLVLISLHGTAKEMLRGARQIREWGVLTDSIPIVIFSLSTVPQGTEEEIDRNIYVTAPDNFDQLRALLARLLYADSPNR